MSDADALRALHLFWTIFFAAFGLLMIFTSKKPACDKKALWAMRVDDPSLASRIREALRKRTEIERISPAVKIAPGIVSILLSVLMVFTRAQAGVLYGTLLLAVAVSMTVAFMLVRNNRPVRVAVLSHRSPASVISPVWFALAVVQGLIALVALQIPAIAVGAASVCASTLLCAGLAWRVTEMPAVLTGDDLAVEQFVDSRLRFWRASLVLYLAFAQVLVFLTQMGALVDSLTLGYATGASVVLFLAFTGWVVSRVLRKIDLPQTAA